MTGKRLSANPVLIGAATVVVVVIAVLIAYNANSGLPFTPTYKLVAQVPDADNLVRGNDVRIGGSRVGSIYKIEPRIHRNSSVTALLYLKLEKKVAPLPTDSTVIIRPKSALGLKYLEITKGTAGAGFKSGATMPLRNAMPAPVELDQVVNTFNAPTRRAQQVILANLGDALAGRGADLNQTIANLVPLLGNLEQVMGNLADNATDLSGFVGELSQTMALLAPVGQTQAELFVNLDTTFSALASVARPYIQDTISGAPALFDQAQESFPIQRPFFRNTAQLMAELKPGTEALRSGAPDLADAVQLGAPALKKAPAFNRQLTTTFKTLQSFSEDPAVPLGLTDLNSAMVALDPTLSFVTPAQTVCNYITLLARNGSSLLSANEQYGTLQRFITVVTPLGPNNEGSPSSAPADGPSADNHLHVNPYPHTAAPRQKPKECEAGNEPYVAGKTVIGNPPGNQGTNTDTDK